MSRRRALFHPPGVPWLPVLSPFFVPPLFFPAPPGGSPKNRSYLKNFCAPEPADLTIPSGSTYALRAWPVVIVAPVAAFVVPICPAWCGAGWLWRVLALAVVLWCGLFAGADGAVLCGFALCAGGAGVAGVAVLCGLSAGAGGAGCGFCRDGVRLLHGAWGDYRGS